MKFGLFGGARAKGGPAGDSHAYHDFVNYVVEAEKLGFSSVFLVEHHFTGFGQVSASMSLLAYLAARTERIRLGTAVVVLPWHNPILVAEQAATLDLLSNGRLDFGVGKGYRDYEFAGFCIPQNEATERFDEAMEVIRKAWTSPGRFSYHGKRWRFDNVVVEPSPIQQPHPPFWLGAGSAESIRRAAREGYNLLLDQIAPTLAVARKAISVSGIFGMYATTRSPRPTPSARSPPATAATCVESSPHVSSASGRSSDAWSTATAFGSRSPADLRSVSMFSA